MLAAMVDGCEVPRAPAGAGASGVRRTTLRAEDAGVRNGSNMSSVLSIMEMCWGDVGLLLSMPRQGLGQLGDRVGRLRRAVASGSTASGRRWRSPSPAAGRTRRTSGRPRAGRRRLRAQRREDLRHRRWALRRRRGVGDARSSPRPRCDQVLRRREGHARHVGRAARAQARASARRTPRRSGSTDCRVPAANLLGIARDRHRQGLRRRHADVRQHPPAGRRDGRRLRARLARTDARRCWRRRASRSTTTAPSTSSAAAAASYLRWRPTGKPPTC